MKKTVLIFLLTLLLVAIVALPVTTAESSGKYVVVFESKQLPKNAENLIIQKGGSVVASLPEIGVIVAESASASFEGDLASEPSVLSVGLDTPTQFIPNTQVSTLEEDVEDPDDPYYDLYQWNMKIINATPDKAWSITTGDPSIKVAILDTGVAWDHPDISANYDFTLSTSFVDENILEPYGLDDTTPMDYEGHGTWCAGAVAADWNGWGVIGVGPDLTIVNVKVMTADGWGYWNWVIQGMYYTGVVGVDVGSMSLGGYLNPKYHVATYTALLRASNFAHQNKVLLVAAAGNDAFDLDLIEIEGEFYPGYDHYPSGLPRVMCVSGITHNYSFSPISNYGYSAVDVSAPCGYWYGYPAPGWWYYLAFSLTSPHCYYDPGWLFAWMDGTSAACPHVAGVAGLILSLHTDLTPGQVWEILQDGAYDLGKSDFDEFYGHGLVDAYQSLLIEP